MYVEVADGVDDIDGLGADFVGGSDYGSFFDSATGHEHGHGVGVVVAAEGVFAAAACVVGGAAEFAASR